MNGAGRIEVGFVGLGAMGGPMVEALLDEGFALAVFDERAEAMVAPVGRGAVACSSPVEVAGLAPIVLVSLPTPEVVRTVACDDDGLVRGSAMRTFVDLSTTGPTVAKEVAEALRAADVSYVDAPVSGGVAGALGRRLTVMAAADGETFERVRPLLRTFATQIFLVGSSPGHGQVAKLLNNLLSATAMLITSEAATFGVRAGLDPSTLLDVFNASTGRNTATSDKFPAQVLTRRFGSGFRLKLMAKDVELCLDEARVQRLPMLVGSVVQQLWTLAAAQAGEQDDHTEVVRLFEAWAGVTVAGPA